MDNNQISGALLDGLISAKEVEDVLKLLRKPDVRTSPLLPTFDLPDYSLTSSRFLPSHTIISLVFSVNFLRTRTARSCIRRSSGKHFTVSYHDVAGSTAKRAIRLGQSGIRGASCSCKRGRIRILTHGSVESGRIELHA